LTEYFNISCLHPTRLAVWVVVHVGGNRITSSRCEYLYLPEPQDTINILLTPYLHRYKFKTFLSIPISIPKSIFSLGQRTPVKNNTGAALDSWSLANARPGSPLYIAPRWSHWTGVVRADIWLTFGFHSSGFVTLTTQAPLASLA
jgi:hypothetical protein